MATGIDRFTKQEFETAISAISWLTNVKPLGMRNGQECYVLTFRSPHVRIMLFSSIDASGRARDTAEDSIRACLCKDADGHELLPGKVTTYTTRRKNWRVNLANSLRQLAQLAAWIQPCPKCQELLRLSIKRKDKEVFLYCPNDAKNRDTPGYQRHVALTVIDFVTGQELRSVMPETPDEPEQADDSPPCPKCGAPMLPMKGKATGKGFNCSKQTWSKEKGRGGCDGTIWL